MKVKSLRIASVLLIAVLLSTCAISGTFAKYTTSGDATATARVAKWGVEIATTSSDPVTFAPGKTANLASAIVTGAPEVDGKVTFGNTVTVTLSGWEDEGGIFYCPLVFKSGDTTLVDGTTATSAADIETALADALKGKDFDFSADDIISEEIDVTAEWAFFVDAATDAKDTFLANQGTLPSIQIELAVTVEQVNN